MKCLNKSLPLVQQTLSVLRSEPLAAKVLDMSGSNPTMDEIMRNYYQLASPLTTQANKELDDFLLNFLKPFGVKSKEFESLKQRLGIDALGATDVLNKLIWYNKERRKDTIPEEAAHMIVMLMGENHSDIKSLLSEIKLWSGYQEVYDKYMPIYNNEKQVKIEAIGKLIAQAMVENYDQYGLDKSLLNKVKQIVKEFFARLDTLFANPLEAYFASKYLADKIAVNVLSGNQNYVANLTNTKEQLNFQKALATNPHAQKIISTFTKDKFKFKLVGSLAIAGQGEKIYRPSSEPIHDLDFIVDNIQDYNDLVNYMDQVGAVPVHNGWKGDNYTTYAYFIPAPGYEVKVTQRKVNGWAEKGQMIEKGTGKVVPMTSTNVIATDFFVYYTKPEETNIDIFKSWQDIYAGKLRMSPLNSEERFFQREKDQQDYVLSTPNNLGVSRSEFVYYQTNQDASSTVKPGVQELFDSNPDLANAVYEALGFKTTTSIPNYEVVTRPTKDIGKSKGRTGNFVEITTPDNYRTNMSAYMVQTNDDGKLFITNIEKYNEDSTFKGFGTVAYVDFFENYKNQGITTDKKLTADGIRLLERLEKIGLVYKTNAELLDDTQVSKIYNTKIYEYDKPLYEFNLNWSRSQITSQQKQQVLQQYSQYLDTIFPDSKVKDIVYHGTKSKEQFERFITERDYPIQLPHLKGKISKGSFFTKDKSIADVAGIRTITAILNMKNPLYRNKGSEYLFKEDVKDIQKNNDSLVAPGNKEELIVFEPEQIHILGSKQDVEGFKQFVSQPSTQSSTYLQIANETSLPTNKELDQKIKNFLDKIGVSVERVNQIKDMNGEPVSAIAKADMLNKIIEIIEGNADLSTLPEEAAHFFVEMLDDNSPLLKEMMDKITSYELYRETVEQYKNRPEYRLPGGGINFVKLKKEAIGKLVAQAIIRQNEGKETPERLSFFNKWWAKLWEFVTKSFSRVEDNPFEQVAKQILSADVSDLNTSKLLDNTYYQLNDGVTKLKEEAKLLRLDNSVDPRTGQKRHIYYRGDKAVSKNVTTAKVDPYYRSIFRQDKRDERKKQLDLLKAEYGDMIHATIEDIIDSYIDPNTNKRRATPVASRSQYVGTDYYNTLDLYVRELISSYDPNTVFMREVKIYDPTQDMAGSIDLIAITPDGTVNIYDWKSQEIGKDKKELPSYKEKAYQIQLQEYVNILRNVYGFNKFGKIRAIPIKTNFNYVGKVGEKKLDSLKSVEIAPLDARYTDPNQDYLLPVTLKEETDEDTNLAEIINKLTNLLERFETIASNAKVSERIKMQDQISKYRKAIRDLHLRKDIRTFIELGSIEVDRYDKMLKNNTLSQRDALESLDILKIFSGTTFYFKNYMTELRKAMNEEKNPAMKQVYQDILNRYNSLNSNAEITVKEMERAIMQLGQKMAEDKAGIQNLLNAETKVGPIAGLFNSLSQIPQRAFKAFYKILRDAQAKRDLLFNQSLQTLQTLQKELGDWAKARNITPEKMFDGILDIDEKGNWNGQFLRKHKKEAYQVRKKAIEEGDVNWIKSNMNFDKTWYEKDLASYTKYVMNMTYHTDPNTNASIQQKTINNWIANHNVMANGDNLTAWLNAQNKYLRFNDTWMTDKWKSLQKPENAPLLKVYNEFQKLLRKSENLGMIDEYSWEFIPSIYKNKIDHLAFGGSVFTSKGFFEELEVGTDDKYTPKIDPISGKVLLSIPVHFTQDIGVEKEDGTVDYSQKSKDLFKVFGIWSAQMANYETLSEIEDAANILVHVERNKEQIVTNNWGEVVKKNGLAQTVPGNERNAKLLESFVNFYLYNKMGDNTTDSKFKFRDKEYSANKTVRWFMKFFSLKTLALNPISGTAQFVGGTGNALFTAGKKTIFTTKDWATSMYQVTKRDPKTIALLHYADILLEDRKDAFTNEHSVSKIVGFNSLDKLYFIQRFSDKAVQYPVAIATMMNHMVDTNGKIVDITKMVKQEFNYDQTYYNVLPAERKALKEKIDARVKELKETKSIYATTKIVKDKLEIPGVDISSKEWFAFKSKIRQVNKTIIGNSTRDDINYARTTQLGMAIMQFRSWMPQMVKERFGKLDYNQDLELYNMGKTRLFFSELIKHPMTIAKSIISSSGTDMIQAAKQRYIEERADAALAGKEFNLTEAEFIDLYIGNIRSQLRELAVVVGMLALIFAAKPGDDEDEERGLRKYITRALEKYYAEFSFYYLPTSFTELVQAPLPVVGLAVDFINFTKASGKQFYGVAVDDTELQEDAKPMKYASRLIPILKEGIIMRAIFDDDFRKDWDIRL